MSAPVVTTMTLLLETLAPSLAYRSERGAYTSRAEKAAALLGRDACTYIRGGRTWRVLSYDRPGLSHFVELSDLSCDCEDFTLAGASDVPLCIHIIAAAMAEVQRNMTLDVVTRAANGQATEAEFERLVKTMFGEVAA